MNRPRRPSSDRPVHPSLRRLGSGAAIILIVLLILSRSVLSPTEGGDILEAFREQRSDVAVEASGRVKRILPDDRVGTPHQKWIVELPSGHTILIAHNIELAPRVPIQRGDSVSFSGVFEYTPEGGVVHWTHHDPQRRHTDGWILHDGRKYQ